jgi:hypothetical protein
VRVAVLRTSCCVSVYPPPWGAGAWALSQILFERSLGEELHATYEANKEAAGLTRRRGAGAKGEETATGAAYAAGEATGAAERVGPGPLRAAGEIHEALALALPLPLLLRITNRLLDVPFASERAMVDALRRHAGNGTPDAALFRIAIRRAEAAGRVLVSPPVPSEGVAQSSPSGVSEDEDPAMRGRHGGSTAAVAVLRGDSLVSPHYRLGVGVNHAMATLPYLAGLIQDLWARGGRKALRAERAGVRRPKHVAATARELVQSWEQSAGADADALVDYQLGVLYVEVECSMLVLGERLFRRDLAQRKLQEVGLSELSDFC